MPLTAIRKFYAIEGAFWAGRQVKNGSYVEGISIAWTLAITLTLPIFHAKSIKESLSGPMQGRLTLQWELIYETAAGPAICRRLRDSTVAEDADFHNVDIRADMFVLHCHLQAQVRWQTPDRSLSPQPLANRSNRTTRFP